MTVAILNLMSKLCKSARGSFFHLNFPFFQRQCQCQCQCRSLISFPILTSSIERSPSGSPRVGYDTSAELHRLSHILEESADLGDFQTALRVHTRLLKLYFDGFVSLWNKLLSLYCKSEQFGIARRLFDTMPIRDVVSFNTMISTRVRNGYGLKTVSFYFKMIEEDVKPSHITLAKLISACDSLSTSQLRHCFHAQAIQYGLSSNKYVGCSLVEGYAKEMRLNDAIKAFSEIVELDLVSRNVAIDACVRNNNKEYALRIFTGMLQENEYDGFTLTSIAKMCLEPAELHLGKLLHGFAIKTSLTYETPMNNALLTMYSRCEGGMTSALKIFGRTLVPNIISWTAVIAGCLQNKHNEEAIGFYKNMLRQGVTDNDFSFATILSACGNMANLGHGRQIHARIVKSYFGVDVCVNNALIDMYSKCGSLQEAHLVFGAMEKHDKISCTTMITAFAHYGKGKEAFVILDKMTREGLIPDDVTFIGCLSACSHGGYLNEGIWMFRMMMDVYNIKPRREHFSCVVDMLGRAGRLTEAESFIEEMGIGSDVFVWETLLGACRIHGEMGLGVKAMRKIIELQPDNHNNYVLLANMYADGGLWEEKGVVLENLVSYGLKKETGCSWLALQNF